jgi:hypothetical protein
MFDALARRHWLADIAAALALGLGPGALAQQPTDVYATYGVHNPPADSPCANPTCVYVREAGQPTDPTYPPYWSSHWSMYRVVRGYQAHPPPYDGAPPVPLNEGQDYEVSRGATYYDSTWRGPTGDGAMMEHYEKRCLPIFPLSNHYTCSFISLGDIAFFLTYDEFRAIRSGWMRRAASRSRSA